MDADTPPRGWQLSMAIFQGDRCGRLAVRRGCAGMHDPVNGPLICCTTLVLTSSALAVFNGEFSAWLR